MNPRSLLRAAFLIFVFAAACKKSNNPVSTTEFDPSVPWEQTNGPYGVSVNSLVASGPYLFAGTDGGVFLSTNNGTTWTAANAGLTNPCVSALILSGTNLVAGTNSDGVFLSTNNGTGWTEVNNGLTNRYVFVLAVLGTDLFAGTAGGVFLSTNNGTNWLAVNNGLTNTNVNALYVAGECVLAGTTGGAFITINNGITWTAINAGLPMDTFVYSFAISGTNLFAGTSTRGVWRRPL